MQNKRKNCNYSVTESKKASLSLYVFEYGIERQKLYLCLPKQSKSANQFYYEIPFTKNSTAFYVVFRLFGQCTS